MSGRYAVGVCGFGRCGSSMTMQMLAAGGLRPVAGSSPGALRDGMAMYADAVRAAVEGVGRAVGHLQAAGVLPPAPPVDARQATLEAVRARRNSGPAARVRTPRRIDPHGGAPRR